MARQLGIERVWRQVVDFGDPKSSGIGDSWGYKRVSVPRVSIIDGDCRCRNEPVGGRMPSWNSCKD